MAWIVRLVSIGGEGEEHSTDVMRIAKPDTLADLGSLGLSLAESKQLLALKWREIVMAGPGTKTDSRQSGTPNRITASVRRMILAAGAIERGEDYLLEQATANPWPTMRTKG